jgi:hypothetical protein
MDALILTANLLYVACYFMNDVLRLRALSVVAASCLACYFYGQPEPKWQVVGWNLFFIALNLVQIARGLRSRRLQRPLPAGALAR